MEIVTGLLSREQLEEELSDIREFFRNHAVTASYMYGWGCDIDVDRQWQVKPMAIEAMVETVEESLASGIFSWGRGDLFLYDGEERFYFLLCHEGDVHFASQDEFLVALVRAAWETRGYKVYEARPSPSINPEKPMAFNIPLNNRISAIIATWEGVEAKKMFGGVCHLLHGNMFAGVYREFLILRLGEDEAARALTLPFVRPLDITGKPMKGWVMVAREGWQTDAELTAWLEKAKAFALSLPRK